MGRGLGGDTQGSVGGVTDKMVGCKEPLCFSDFATQLRPMGSDPLPTSTPLGIAHRFPEGGAVTPSCPLAS